MPNLINDPYFKVTIDLNASSPNPAAAIWTAQNTCVTEGFAPDNPIPRNPAAAIIKHQFKPKHWSVLKFAFVKLDFGGFPHPIVMQLVRHQDSDSSVDDGFKVAPLVQSMRYTGSRISNYTSYDRDSGSAPSGSPTHTPRQDIDIEEIFYVQPVGRYQTRNGCYDFTQSDRHEYLAEYQLGAEAYSRAIAKGHSEETARGLLPNNFRQNFTLAGTIQAVFHWLDQRTLADSQIEAQTLAWMALDRLEEWEPGLFNWYRENRAGKNLLSP
jgi:thymidylate synthase (FAD)